MQIIKTIKNIIFEIKIRTVGVELHSGIVTIDGKKYKKFDGSEVNGCWQKGDYRYNDIGDFIQVPDCWHLEDLRQRDIIYRPL